MPIATAEERRAESQAARGPSPIVDCDVHNALRSPAALKPYLAERWHRAYDQGVVQTGLVVGARPHRDIFRRDAVPSDGPPGSDLELMREQLLDRHNVGRAILHPVLTVLRTPTAGPLAAAIIAALNRWMTAEWLEQDARLFGAVSVTVEDGIAAAQEIAATSDERRFVKVMFPIQTREGMGHAKYWPIYEAAVERGLPIAAHVGGFTGTHMATGWPTYWVEQHASFPQVYAAQVTSLVYSGVFERFPDLRIVMEEGGIAWVPSLMWRLDHSWTAMRDDLPHLSTAPSELIRRHFAFTTQPLDEPEHPRFLADVLEQLDMDDRIMFASDYPHWDFDDPRRVLTRAVVGAERREQILHGNADRFFDFG
jgi:predicted TIM-barrel fold metal-dependent hydrolase